MALVDLSVVEQRYRAVLAVLGGGLVSEVAAEVGVSRQSLSTWKRRYLEAGPAGLADQPKRPRSSPWQTSGEVEALVCELRRGHPRWGALRLVHDSRRRLACGNGCGSWPSRCRRGRRCTGSWSGTACSPAGPGAGRGSTGGGNATTAMALWQMDIVGGVFLASPRGDREAKVVTGVDDHSRFCVIAAVVPRATGRAVCLALVRAMREYGIPEEILTDNGKQFTDRFGKGGEVLFDRICRDNGITAPADRPGSPTTTGKVERFHLTLRRELLDEAGVFADLAAAQAAVDAFGSRVQPRPAAPGLGHGHPGVPVRPRPGRPYAAGQADLPLRVPSILTPAAAPPAPADRRRRASSAAGQ